MQSGISCSWHGLAHGIIDSSPLKQQTMRNYFMVKHWFCQKCAEGGAPMIGDSYVFFKINNQITALQQFSEGPPKGYTSHLFQYSDPLEFKNGLVKVSITCCRNGCGIDTNPYNLFIEGMDSVPIKFLQVDDILLPYEEFRNYRRQSNSFSEFQIL